MEYRTLLPSDTCRRAAPELSVALAAAPMPTRLPGLLPWMLTPASVWRPRPAKRYRPSRCHPSLSGQTPRRCRCDEKLFPDRATLSRTEESAPDRAAPTDSLCIRLRRSGRRALPPLFSCARLAHASSVGWHPDRDSSCFPFRVFPADCSAEDFHCGVGRADRIRHHSIGPDARGPVAYRLQQVAVADIH